MRPHTTTSPATRPAQGSLADLWHEMDPGTDALAAGLLPVATVFSAPYRDSRGWLLLKHVVQAGFAGSVFLLVLLGGSSPALAIAYAATGLLLMSVMAVADRRRFEDAAPDFQVVEYVQPMPQQVQPAPAPVRGPQDVVALIERLQAAMPDRVEVT